MTRLTSRNATRARGLSQSATTHANKAASAAPRGTKPLRRSVSQPPPTFRDFVAKFPELGNAHEAIAKAVDRAGPLDAKCVSLIKIGICLGAGLESALRSHVRRGLQHGASKAEIEQAILAGMNTVGFPRTVAGWAWANEQFARGS